MKFNKVLTAIAASVAVIGSAQAAMVIDTFDITQALILDNAAAAAPLTTAATSTNLASGVGSTSAMATAADIIGGQRDMMVYKTSNSVSPTGRVDAEVIGGVLSFNQANSTNGFAVVRWDGAATAYNQAVDVDGLGGVNMSLAGVQILVGTNVDNAGQSYNMTFQVWTDTGAGYTLSEVTKSIVSNGGDKDVSFSFNDFVGANFAKVGAIQMIVNTGGVAMGGLDFSIDIVGAVPEPGSVALVGAALLALGAARRRRQA